jgi:phosphoesterase RecJ-like protein
MGKKVTILLGDSAFPNNFNNLSGVKNILAKNFFQINPDNYDLFIIADISDEKRISKQGEVSIPKTLKTIVIDHHLSSTKFADINLVDSESPATCQLVYELLEVEKIKITKEIAACLFIGIYTDTGGFKYRNTTSETFSIAANLTKIYPNFDKLIFEVENNDEPDRLKFLSNILSSINTYCSGKVTIASIDFATIKKNNINNGVVNGSEIANMIKSVVGWDIGISLIESQPNVIKISFRTRDSKKYDLTKISLALGGGGHRSAAGVVLTDLSISEANKLLLDKLKKIYKLN